MHNYHGTYDYCLKYCLKYCKYFFMIMVSRRQRVVVNGYSSDWSTVSSGVPQGSIPGPLLFLLYVNDMFNVNDIGTHLKSQIRLFADDSAVFLEK